MSYSRNEKVIYNAMGNRLMCCWDTCDRDGYELYKFIIHEHVGFCDDFPEEHMNMVFCSERHRQYHINSKNNLGYLPAGYRKSI